SELRDAKVINGDAESGLRVSAADGRSRQLGWLVPNHLIRRAAYGLVAQQPGGQLQAGQGGTGAARDGGQVARTSEGGDSVHARLLVAADSRFSQLRRMLGIGARS